jgi:hypothetical protein
VVGSVRFTAILDANVLHPQLMRDADFIAIKVTNYPMQVIDIKEITA